MALTPMNCFDFKGWDGETNWTLVTFSGFPDKTTGWELGIAKSLQTVIERLIRTGTLLERLSNIPEDKKHQFHNGRGTFVGGIPYLEQGEPWPVCQHHKVEMKFVLQVDQADALHASPFSGIYTIFTCAAPFITRFTDQKLGKICQPCIRHHANPGTGKNMSKSTMQKNEVIVFQPVQAIDFLPSIHLLDHIAAAHDLKVEIDEQLYKWMKEQGWSSRLYDDHLGGWHVTNWDRQTTPPDCKNCSKQLQLVISIESGDGNRSLWACPQHPKEAFYTFHK